MSEQRPNTDGWPVRAEGAQQTRPRRIAVFGSGAPLLPDAEAYRNAFRLGQLLGEAGFVVLTGGYDGTMAAVSRGAWLAGGTVIGVTMTLFSELPNPWLTEEIRVDRFSQRLAALCDDADGYVAFPGGVGTLNELGYVWSLLLTGAVPPRPLVLIGQPWRQVLAAMRAAGFPLQAEIDPLTTIVDRPEEALARLGEAVLPAGASP